MTGSEYGLDLPITETRFRDLNCELFIALIFQTILPYPVYCTYPMTMYCYNGRERGFMVVAPIRQRNCKEEIPPSTTILAPCTYELNPLARNPTTFATSSGSPDRSSPTVCLIYSEFCKALFRWGTLPCVWPFVVS